MVELRENQLEEAVRVIRETAAWGREQGYRVWLDEWLTQEELLTSEVKPENFYTGYVDGKCACAFILQWSDVEHWPDAAKDEAVYLHKFCVKREFAHQGITKQTVDALKEECKRRGIKYIRLNTGLDEKVVRKIYLEAGFHIVDVIDREAGRTSALYELEVEQEPREVLNEIYGKVNEIMTRIQLLLGEKEITYQWGYYKNHSYRKWNGEWRVEAFPIPVISIENYGDLGIEIDSVFFEVVISRNHALDFDFHRLADTTFELYGAEMYTQDYYNQDMDLDGIRERIENSMEEAFGIQFYISFDKIEQQLEYVLKLFQECKLNV